MLMPYLQQKNGKNFRVLLDIKWKSHINEFGGVIHEDGIIADYIELIEENEKWKISRIGLLSRTNPRK